MAAHARELDKFGPNDAEETIELTKNHAKELDAQLSAARLEAEETMKDLRAAVTDASVARETGRVGHGEDSPGLGSSRRRD